MSSYFTGDWFADNYIMTTILDNIEFYCGGDRVRMMTKNKMKAVPKSVGGSMLYGLTWRSRNSDTKTKKLDEETGLYMTKIKEETPELNQIFREFAFYYFPDFKWEQVQMNKNYKCPPHKDSQNIGESVLCCFGDFKGGETVVEYEDKQLVVNASFEPVKFNGSLNKHYVKDFTGTRYSLVFFKNYDLEKRKKKNK
tara:strand:- start:271 stop:858 length:588 start_codon:yes stop_codon:yes gene_type:complete